MPDTMHAFNKCVKNPQTTSQAFCQTLLHKRHQRNVVKGRWDAEGEKECVHSRFLHSGSERSWRAGSLVAS